MLHVRAKNIENFHTPLHLYHVYRRLYKYLTNDPAKNTTTKSMLYQLCQVLQNFSDLTGIYDFDVVYDRIESHPLAAQKIN